MLIGYLYLRFSDHWRNISFNFRKRIVELKTSQKDKNIKRETKLKQEVDRLLDKANICGWESLSREEQAKLQSSSWKLSSNKPKD